MIKRQPEVNIGLVGHIDHGKTTLTEALTGKWTDTHSEELRRGITIKLGYADTNFYKCPKCKEPEAYTTKEICGHCGSKTEFLRRVSFVDAPGHETLMATMLSGAAIMDGALLIVAANEPCPQPQTKEHLIALEIIGVKNVVVVQNKIDLVSKERALKSYEEIKKFLENTQISDAPIIPISAQHKVNIDVLIQAIEEFIPTPKRDLNANPKFYVARSFDVNKPGTPPEKLVGGVLGGSLIQGKLKVGQEIEIRPGIYDKKEGWQSLITEIASLYAGDVKLEEVHAGGSIAIGTYLDPNLTKADALVGNVVGLPGKLPDMLMQATIEYNLLERVVGLDKEIRVEPLKVNEPLMMTCGTRTTLGIVTKVKKEYIEVTFKLPICAEEGDRVTISRQVKGRWRLIGYGIIK